MDRFLEIIYNYYPRNMYPSDLEYSYTPEWTRLLELLRKERKNDNAFKELCKHLETVIDGFVLDYSFPAHDPSWHTKFQIPKKNNSVFPNECGIYISVLCNYYCIYFSDRNFDIIPSLRNLTTTEGELELSRKLQKILKEYFPDHEPFPHEWLDKTVPEVCTLAITRDYDELATYFECLITTSL